ncbi:MAG: hypothetical protein ACYDCK_13095 [Thermoplasmatota archaeon]
MTRMVSKKWIIAGVATLALVGVGIAAAEASTTNDTVNASATVGASATAPVHKDPRACDRDGKDGDKCRGLAAYKETNGTVSGRNVAFTVDASTGAITNYESRGAWGDTTIFDSISFASYNGSAAKESVHGPIYMLRDAPDVSFLSFDARNAGFFVWSKSGETVSLAIPAGTNVTVYPKEPGWAPAGALLTKDGHSAKLTLHGDAQISAENGTLVVKLGPHSGMYFRVVGYPGETAKELKFAKHAQDRTADRRAKAAKKGSAPQHDAAPQAPAATPSA